RTFDGAGTSGGTTSKQTWQLAPRPGVHTMYLMARDGRGGYAYKRFDIPVGGTTVDFSGLVIDETTQNPVPNAAVSVNGVNTTTNAQGWFRVAVPPAPDPERYV